MIDYKKIPEYMIESIKIYVEEGRPLGGFLEAVFANDLYRAVALADEKNLNILSEYVAYVHWETPANCQGSYEKVGEWLRKKRSENE